jgi:hypothetical protein
MITLWGSRQHFCDGITRRGFLRIGAFGAGLSLAEMLRLRAVAGQGTGTRAKAAIMVYLPGGPSHMDMWDLKPDAPKEFRGEFNPIPTNVPGIEICEHFPLQAKMFDRMSVIRSIVSVDEHSDSLVMTGYPERINRVAGHPSFGSVVSKLRGNSLADVPAYVSLRGMSQGTEPGILGVSHRPFTPSGPGLENLKLANGVDASRVADRRSLLSRFDDIRRDLDASGTMAGMDDFTARAFDMVASGAVHRALDPSKEDPRVRDRYKGIESFLTARRLIEAGVGCVTLSYGGWDTHSQNFNTLRRQLPALDRGIANLVQDLDARGMLDDVALVVWGEFGRTPKINNNQGGRDHWAPAMSALVAGGGLKHGQAIGSTTARGERPKERPVTASQVLATLYRALGIDPSITFPNGSGRPVYILDDREPIRELV